MPGRGRDKGREGEEERNEGEKEDGSDIFGASLLALLVEVHSCPEPKVELLVSPAFGLN